VRIHYRESVYTPDDSRIRRISNRILAKFRECCAFAENILDVVVPFSTERLDVLIFVIKASVLPLPSRSKREKPKVMCKLISPFVLAGEIAILFAADTAMRVVNRTYRTVVNDTLSRVVFFSNGKTAEIGAYQPATTQIQFAIFIASRSRTREIFITCASSFSTVIIYDLALIYAILIMIPILTLRVY